MIKARRRTFHSNNSFESLASVLGSSFKSIGFEARLKEHNVIVQWGDIVGKQIASVTKPIYVKFKTLFVNVSNHIWMHQLVFLEEEIIKKANQHLKHDVIKKIHFKLGDVE